MTCASSEKGQVEGKSSLTRSARAKALTMDLMRPPNDFLRNESSATLSNFWAIAGSCTDSPSILVPGSHALSTAYRSGPVEKHPLSTPDIWTILFSEFRSIMPNLCSSWLDPGSIAVECFLLRGRSKGGMRSVGFNMKRKQEEERA